jgi:cyclophilin family peptidyl-prolyl cis-trans isomerase
MQRVLALVLIVVPGGLLGGCPPDSTSNEDLPPDVFVQSTAPSNAAKGQTVALSASLNTDVSDVSYRWFQTFGRAVTLLGADTAEASFVVPSLKEPATVAFRVDALRRGSVISAAEVQVRIEADPAFGTEDRPEGDGGDDNPFPQVQLTTSKGVIILELNREKAPLTVNNFLRYVDDGFYDGTIFHRVIPDFVVQGGGFEPGLIEKRTRAPIRNEASNGLKNDRGTVAMARTNNPDSATSQFYINQNPENNDDLNARDDFPGYCVFGRVVQGMAVVDEIAAVTTESRNGFDDVPVEDVLLVTAVRFSGTAIPDPPDEDKDD